MDKIKDDDDDDTDCAIDENHMMLNVIKTEPIDTNITIDDDRTQNHNKKEETIIPKIIIKRSRKSSKPSKNLSSKSLKLPSTIKIVEQEQEESSSSYQTLTDYDRQSLEEKIMESITSKTKNVHIKSFLKEESTNHYEQQQQQINSDDENDAHTERSILLLNNHKRPRLSYEKRLEANARERERVHNLTAAFESLRTIIPMYPDQPKLSRLSILRIACSYILTLGSLNEIDFSEGKNNYTFNECFYMLSNTIICELKRKKSTRD